MDPVNAWKSWTTSEFVTNSRVLGCRDGSIFVLNEFAEHGGKEGCKALRVYDTRSGKWFIPTIQQERIMGIVGELLLFLGHKNGQLNPIVFGTRFSQLSRSDFLQEAPEWATQHLETTLAGRRSVHAYWSRKQIEVRDSNGIIFQFNHHYVSRQTVGNVQHVRENGIVVILQSKIIVLLLT